MFGAEHAGRGLEVPELLESASYVLWRILPQLLNRMLAERVVIVFNIFILRLSKISVSFAASHSRSSFHAHRRLWPCALRTLENFSEKPGRAEWNCFYLSPTRVCNFFFPALSSLTLPFRLVLKKFLLGWTASYQFGFGNLWILKSSFHCLESHVDNTFHCKMLAIWKAEWK